MGYSEPIDEEHVSAGAYSVGFQSVVDPTVQVTVQMTDGDGGGFFGADSDALVQEIVDLLSMSELMTFSGASRSWRVRRQIMPTEDASVPDVSP